MERKYGNVGVLDIRNTEEKVFEDQFKFGNIGTIIYSRKTSSFLKHIRAGNVGSSVECDDEVQLVNGKSVLGSEALGKLAAPLCLMVMGKLVITDDVSAAAFEKGVRVLQVSGKVLCPSDLLPVVQAKALNVNGKIETYPSGYRLVEKSMRLDRAQLTALPMGAKLAVMGDVSFGRDVTAKALRERIAGLFVKGVLAVPEELLEAIQPALHPQGANGLSVIPEGYEVVPEEAQVGPTELALWEGAKVFFSGSVRFSPDVKEGDLNRLEAFIAKEEVYCRESLLPFMGRKCNRFQTKFVPYRDRLFFNEGQAELARGQLTQLAETVTIVNQGVLNFDPSITAEEIRTKVHAIRNAGVLTVSAEQMAAVREKAVECEGPIVANSAAKAEEEEQGVGNIGLLKL